MSEVQFFLYVLPAIMTAYQAIYGWYFEESRDEHYLRVAYRWVPIDPDKMSFKGFWFRIWGIIALIPVLNLVGYLYAAGLDATSIEEWWTGDEIEDV